jgi:hypothetical protein
MVDLAVGEPGQTRVGYRHAMGIAAEIGQHLLGSCERALGIDHPCDRRSVRSDTPGVHMPIGVAIRRGQGYMTVVTILVVRLYDEW